MVQRKAPQRKAPDAGIFARRLLAWYDRARRDLPWRAAPGGAGDPYRVWLSEIMLQQTTVATVGPYFMRFLARWPDVHALAAAPLDTVLTEWAGLGYYARARNLKKCAETVSRDLGGRFPDTEAGLAALPGIGPYTAAAVAAIAFDRPATVVDGNVERVIARIFAVTDPMPASKPALREKARGLTPSSRPGDYAQAMMDLGATICRPRTPLCSSCPVAGDCAARQLGIAPELPRRAAKKARPVRRAVAWLGDDGKGAIVLRRRAESGLLGGMWEVPSSDWQEELDPEPMVPVAAGWETAGMVVHVFTHFRLEMEVRRARLKRGDAARFGSQARWVGGAELGDYALPSLMKKVIKAGA